MDTSIISQAAPVVFALAAASVLEACVPLRARARRPAGQLRTNYALWLMTLALGAALNLVLTVLAVLVALRGFGLLALLPARGVVQLVLGVIVLDLAAYGAHVAMHRSARLWRIHQVHHLDPVVDASTALRQHPLEGLVRAGFAAIAVVAFGVTPAALALGRLLAALNAVFEHADIRVPRALDRLLGLVWVTPDMHKLHHADQRALADSNYANLFPLFDRAFGTYTSPQALAPLRYGIAGRTQEPVPTLRAMLALPFQRDRAALRATTQLA